MKGTCIFLADGYEEIEALATVDVLRRGEIEVRTVSNNDNALVTGAHGITVTADMNWSDFMAGIIENGTDEKDVMVFPGGMPGTKNLAENKELIDLMKRHYAEGGTVAAICAAPGLVVSQLPSLKGKMFTCYDGFEAAPVAKGGEYSGAPGITVISDGNLITGRGPGCAVDFALAIVEHLKGSELAGEIRRSMMIFN